MYILAPTTDTTSTTPHAISNIMPVSNNILRSHFILKIVDILFLFPFLILFVVLFAMTGIGNGSTFRTTSQIFNKEQAGPVLGWTSAVAAYGAFIVPKVFGEQIKATTPENALYGFAVFYAVCMVINWWFYLRKNAEFHNP